MAGVYDSDGAELLRLDAPTGEQNPRAEFLYGSHDRCGASDAALIITAPTEGMMLTPQRPHVPGGEIIVVRIGPRRGPEGSPDPLCQPGALLTTIYLDTAVLEHAAREQPWPPKLPMPTVSVDFNDGLETLVVFGPYSLTLWTAPDGVLNDLTGNIYCSWPPREHTMRDMDDDLVEAVTAWAEDVHLALECVAYGAQVSSMYSAPMQTALAATIERALASADATPTSPVTSTAAPPCGDA